MENNRIHVRTEPNRNLQSLASSLNNMKNFTHMFAAGPNAIPISAYKPTLINKVQQSNVQVSDN